MEHQLLVEALVHEIEQGNFVDGNGKLPSEKNMMAHYQISRYALRQALSKLSSMGYIYQVQGMGSFIRKPQVAQTSGLSNDLGLTEEMARVGKKIETIRATQRSVTVKEVTFLPENTQLEADEPLIEVTRYRTLAEKPYLIEKSYYLSAVVGEIPDKVMYESMFTYFEQQKAIKIAFIDKFISCQPLNKEDAEFFGMEAGMPTLMVRDDTYLREGELLAFSRIFYDYRAATLFMHKKIS